MAVILGCGSGMLQHWHNNGGLEACRDICQWRPQPAALHRLWSHGKEFQVGQLSCIHSLCSGFYKNQRWKVWEAVHQVGDPLWAWTNCLPRENKHINNLARQVGARAGWSQSTEWFEIYDGLYATCTGGLRSSSPPQFLVYICVVPGRFPFLGWLWMSCKPHGLQTCISNRLYLWLSVRNFFVHPEFILCCHLAHTLVGALRDRVGILYESMKIWHVSCHG